MDRYAPDGKEKQHAAKKWRRAGTWKWVPMPKHIGPAVIATLGRIRRKRDAYGRRQQAMAESATAEHTDLEVRVNLVKTQGSKTKAFVSIRIKNVPKIGPMALNHIRIVDGKKGLFVSMPSQKGKEVEGQPTEYYDHFHPVTKEGRDAINELVMQAYEKKLASV